MKNNIVKKKQTLSEIFTNISSGITGVFVFVILVIFPLYTHQMYFDILGARYVFFKFWAIILVSIQLLLGIIYLFIDKQNASSSPSALKRFFDSFIPKNLVKKLIVTDYFFFAMLLVCIISTLGSSFKEESFFGNAGRYQGLECWILYFVSYVCITRTYKFKILHLDIAILSGCFASIWGILDFFLLDPFGFFRYVSENQKHMFASSVGNLNTFTNYTIMVFAIASILFIQEKKMPKTIFYALASIICSCGCIFGLADNSVLGYMAFFIATPFFVFKTKGKFIRYLFTIDFFLISIFLFWFLRRLHAYNSWQDSFFFSITGNKSIFNYLFIPFTILIIVLMFIMLRKKNNNTANIVKPADEPLNKLFRIVYTALVIFGFVFIVYILLDVNVFKQHIDIWMKLPSAKQLVFDDNWGTHRGHNWRIAFTNFIKNFDLFKKLFGYGPDTYLVVSERTFYEEMVKKYGEVYDSAHNEYINYLICEGLLGLIAYLGTFISGIYYGIKNSKYTPAILACAVAVICYMAQAFVNIAIPITTPIFFTLMYIGVSKCFKISDINEQSI